jgi:integrase
LRIQQEEVALRGDKWTDFGLIFPSEAGTPKGSRNLERDYYLYRTAAGLSKEVNFHMLRHSTATWLDEMGIGEAVIAAILGHSSGSVTRRYLHPRLAAMREAIEQLEKLLIG